MIVNFLNSTSTAFFSIKDQVLQHTTSQQRKITAIVLFVLMGLTVTYLTIRSHLKRKIKKNKKNVQISTLQVQNQVRKYLKTTQDEKIEKEVSKDIISSRIKNRTQLSRANNNTDYEKTQEENAELLELLDDINSIETDEEMAARLSKELNAIDETDGEIAARLSKELNRRTETDEEMARRLSLESEEDTELEDPNSDAASLKLAQALQREEERKAKKASEKLIQTLREHDILDSSKLKATPTSVPLATLKSTPAPNSNTIEKDEVVQEETFVAVELETVETTFDVEGSEEII